MPGDSISEGKQTFILCGRNGSGTRLSLEVINILVANPGLTIVVGRFNEAEYSVEKPRPQRRTPVVDGKLYFPPFCHILIFGRSTFQNHHLPLQCTNPRPIGYQSKHPQHMTKKKK